MPDPRVEYRIVDKDGDEWDTASDKLLIVEELAYYARRFPENAPYYLIERTITERVLAPQEET